MKMQKLTRERLDRLDENGFLVYYVNDHFAFVRKWSKRNSKKGWLPIYVLVKIVD